MVSLELTIDASGMERGAAQAGRALDSVSTRAQATNNAISSINKVAAGTSGVLQVGQSISTAATSFEKFNVAAAGFASSNALIGIARASSDFATMGGRIGAAATAFSAFNPLILGISVALSAAAVAMSLFADSTERAESAFKGLVDGSAQIQSLDKVAKFFDSTELQKRADQRYVSSLQDAAAKIFETGQSPTFQDLRQIIGNRTTEQQLNLSLANAGNEGAKLAFGGQIQPGSYLTGEITKEQALSVLREFAIRNAPDGQARAGAASQGYGLNSYGSIYNDYLVGGAGTVRNTPEQQRGVDRQQAQEMADAAREVEESARRTGEYFGSAAADLVLGLRSAKEVAASIVQDFVRLGLQKATSGVFEAFAKSFNGTGQQASGSNIQLPD